MTGLDYIVIVGYLAGLFTLGLWCSRGQTTPEDYFVAGRRMRGLVLGMSLWASLTSANSLLAAPGYSYKNDLQFVLATPVALLSALLITRFIIPVFQRLHIVTAYEYLEQRFGLSVRCLGSLLFLLLRGAWLGGLIYAPALAVATAVDFPGLSGHQLGGIDAELAACILIVGVVATVYTALGGMKAVIYTDVIQFLVIAVGVFWIAFRIVAEIPGGAAQIWEVGSGSGRTDLFDFRASPFIEVTIWWIILNTMTQRLYSEGLDQVSVQRYLSARSVSDSRRAVLLNVLFDFPLMTTFSLIGLGLFVFYRAFPDAQLPENPDQVFPFFVATRLPAGMSGLFFAALLAATQSSVDSGINSMSATIVRDWYLRMISPHARTDRQLRVARATTLVLGLLATVSALYYIKLGQIYEAVGTAMGFFMGPLLGIFLLGLFTSRAQTAGVLCGAVAGLVATFAWRFWIAGTWMLLPVWGTLATLVVGYLASIGLRLRETPAQ